MNNDSRIYVAGHTGLVGSAIVRQLKAGKYRNLITPTHSELDLMRQQSVEDFFKREQPDYVFLSAAKVGGILANKTYPAAFIYNNLMIQSNIIHAAHQAKIKGLMFLGSSCVYPKNCPQPIKEEYLLTGPLESTNEAYAIAKIAGLKMCEFYHQQYGDPFFSVMPTNMYGPNDNYDLKTSHVLPALIRKTYLAKCLMDKQYDLIQENFKRHSDDIPNQKTAILERLQSIGISLDSDGNKVKLELWGSGKPYREFLYVDDLAEAALFLMLNKQKTSLVNVGTGQDCTIANLSVLVADVVGYSGKITFDASKPDGTPKKLLDVSLLTAMGWSASTELKKGIEFAFQHYLSND
jgi:GDP-L-fucose synthase